MTDSFRRFFQRAESESDRPHEQFVTAVYRGCLLREPDPSGFRTHLERLQSGQSTWAEVIGEFVTSAEFRSGYTRRGALQSLHQARMALFRDHLPPADAILDLGGAADNAPEGALFALGYPHTPTELIIVDLPPADRFTGKERAELEQGLTAQRGTIIRYVYRSMADLAFMPDASVNLVVSGESIEHITESDADIVCSEAFRILKPGGHFCLDTPNARLTRIESPDSLIHPEHKKEYLPSEIRVKLEANGFVILQALGVCPMPNSVRQGRFLWDEMFVGSRVSDAIDDSYVFFFDALKPL